MKTIILKLSDDEYRKLEEDARKEGFVLISDYIRHILLSDSVQDNLQSYQKIERKVQDMINPFTQQIDDLKRRLADAIERIDEMEELVKKPSIEGTTEKKKDEEGQTKKKTIVDILKERKVLYENEMKARDPSAIINKLRSTGIARIISTTKGRIAIENEFFDMFIRHTSSIKSKDVEEAASQLQEPERKLFKTLVGVGLIYYDNEKNSWIVVTGKT
ncbi:hypothetical protein [Sulfuracidifex metallicus]|uniref:CopG family transcriptional regulator n=2 Tax=Sulfuracidifex metallicus TaxID=47303 RepID=A0A6A9QN48_SULME|nr:hypothetical protein [Sulfuracidifex metallicus]MUN28695.1 hypothetical protein [Sulfuracidifex metallicus DSM 6482 = JCM 9184]